MRKVIKNENKDMKNAALTTGYTAEAFKAYGKMDWELALIRTAIEKAENKLRHAKAFGDKYFAGEFKAEIKSLKTKKAAQIKAIDKFMKANNIPSEGDRVLV